jgi:Sec-independent protein translocase protein TatA
MDLLVFLAVAVILFGAGYGFRGLISRELKVVLADFKAEVAKLRADLTAVEAKAKAEEKKM